MSSADASVVKDEIAGGDNADKSDEANANETKDASKVEACVKIKKEIKQEEDDDEDEGEITDESDGEIVDSSPEENGETTATTKPPTTNQDKEDFNIISDRHELDQLDYDDIDDENQQQNNNQHTTPEKTTAAVVGTVPCDKVKNEDIKEEKEEEKEEEVKKEVKKVKKKPEEISDGEIVSSDEEEPAKDKSKNGDMEEGEFSEPGEDKDEVCKFYLKGICTWGDRCRYQHPDEDNKGGYSMFDSLDKKRNPLEPSNAASKMAQAASREAETPWERALRVKKEMRKQSMQRKVHDPEFVLKREVMSLNNQLNIDPDLDFVGQKSLVDETKGYDPLAELDMDERFTAPSNVEDVKKMKSSRISAGGGDPRMMMGGKRYPDGRLSPNQYRGPPPLPGGHNRSTSGGYSPTRYQRGGDHHRYLPHHRGRDQRSPHRYHPQSRGSPPPPSSYMHHHHIDHHHRQPTQPSHPNPYDRDYRPPGSDTNRSHRSNLPGDRDYRMDHRLPAPEDNQRDRINKRSGREGGSKINDLGKNGDRHGDMAPPSGGDTWNDPWVRGRQRNRQRAPSSSSDSDSSDNSSNRRSSSSSGSSRSGSSSSSSSSSSSRSSSSTSRSPSPIKKKPISKRGITSSKTAATKRSAPGGKNVNPKIAPKLKQKISPSELARARTTKAKKKAANVSSSSSEFSRSDDDSSPSPQQKNKKKLINKQRRNKKDDSDSDSGSDSGSESSSSSSGSDSYSDSSGSSSDSEDERRRKMKKMNKKLPPNVAAKKATINPASKSSAKMAAGGKSSAMPQYSSKMDQDRRRKIPAGSNLAGLQPGTGGKSAREQALIAQRQQQIQQQIRDVESAIKRKKARLH